MSFETISEEGQEDYEIWTCDDCGHQIILNGVGGDVCECPICIEKQYAQEAEKDAEREFAKMVEMIDNYSEDELRKISSIIKNKLNEIDNKRRRQEEIDVLFKK